ncbi:hypothetical protein DPMN_189158 [Dreissena polymorpha]|uniref:Uncharacterized protein n=1 Tax=Dreissena polymorpha TaxID=45954 RepID=A0A9D4DSP0_DREPO|nr:hypothetical protein DPMN_189158 [Dreissena polymorpha]
MLNEINKNTFIALQTCSQYAACIRMVLISLIVMAPCLLVVAETTEFQCTPFNYEEKLLEKMVRMELNMEQVLKRMNGFEEILLRENRMMQSLCVCILLLPTLSTITCLCI